MSERPKSAVPRPFDNGAWSEKRARFLFFSGWVITLLYLPSGLMHFLFGNGVYFRDGLLFLHLAGCIHWLARTRELKSFARRHWILLVPAFFVLPACADGGARVEALTFIKWGLLWLDWIILGRLAGFVPGFTTTVKVLLAVTVLMLLAELGAGVYERATHTFIISGETADRTAFGVEVDREREIGDQLRVKGLQRDVFSFGNLMGLGSVLGLVFFVNAQRPAVRLAALVWTIGFSAMLIMSGGRSAFFGVAVDGALAAVLLMAPDWVRRYYPRIVLGWLAACLLISFFGVGQISESVGSSVLDSKGVGNSVSAYERDNNWAGIFDAIERTPVVLIFGSSFSAVLDSKVDIFYHWADNEYMWLLYHTGVLGFVAVVWFFASKILLRAEGKPRWALDTIILFLLFVMGEAVARESMTFIGVVPLFAAIGFYQAGQPAAPAVEAVPVSGQRPRRVRSPSAELTRRIQAKMKERE